VIPSDEEEYCHKCKIMLEFGAQLKIH